MTTNLSSTQVFSSRKSTSNRLRSRRNVSGVASRKSSSKSYLLLDNDFTKESHDIVKVANAFLEIFEAKSPKQGVHSEVLTISDWHKSSNFEFDDSIFERVSKKILAIIRTQQSDCVTINDECAYRAFAVSRMLASAGLLPKRVTGSTEGSISFEFSCAPTYASIELFNEGDIVYLLDKDDKISSDAININALKDIIVELRDMIGNV